MHKIVSAIIINLLFWALSAQVHSSDVKRQFPASQINEIMLGEQIHYTYTVEAKVPLPIGVTWIFASEGNGKLAFNAAKKLSDDLSFKGWHVVVVSPSWLHTAPQPTEMSSDNAPSEPSPEIMPWQSTSYQAVDFDNAKMQLSAIMAELNLQTQDKLGFRLFIAEGMAASVLMALGEEANATLPDALTVVSPFWPDTQVNVLLADYGAVYPSPVLDINYESANRWSQGTYLDRKVQAQVQIKTHYRQRNLPRHSIHHATDWLSGEIVGWTRSLGW